MTKRPALKLPVVLAVFCGLGLAVALQAGFGASKRMCGKPWVFFDLGETLVSKDPQGRTHYAPGAVEYLRSLRKNGYRVGLITNVPEKWGTTAKQKINTLKRTLASEWTTETGSQAMDWTGFTEEQILVPPTDLLRKPAPYLFRSALSQAALENGETACPIVFQGENPKEVEAARSAGMIGYQVGLNPGAFFLPLAELEKSTLAVN